MPIWDQFFHNKLVVCWSCKNIGHYANECPNPKAPERYVPLCGWYGEQSHITTQCQKIMQQIPHSMGETLITKVPNLREYIASNKEVRLVEDIMPNLKEKALK